MIRVNYSCYIMLYSVHLISDFLVNSQIESVSEIHFLGSLVMMALLEDH